MAKVFEMSNFTYKLRTNGPKLFSPALSIISSTTGKVSQNSPENSDKSTAQGKERG
jgi:hypothetical protein